MAGLLDYLRPALTQYGDWDLARAADRRLLRRGTSAQRQRDLLADGRTDADIVEAIVAETAGS